MKKIKTIDKVKSKKKEIDKLKEVLHKEEESKEEKGKKIIQIKEVQPTSIYNAE